MKVNKSLSLLRDLDRHKLVELQITDKQGNATWTFVDKDDAKKIVEYLSIVYGFENK